MAKPARGLPEGFLLDLPDEPPVVIGDFLDEAPPPIPVRRAKERALPEPRLERFVPAEHLSREIAPIKNEVGERPAPRPAARSTTQPSILRYQLNLTPKSKTMLEELVEHIRMYSPQNDARTSEVFQGIMTLLHNAMDDLELSELPRRGAWGSVTAKNFPGALSEAFERAIVQAANKRRIQ